MCLLKKKGPPVLVGALRHPLIHHLLQDDWVVCGVSEELAYSAGELHPLYEPLVLHGNLVAPLSLDLPTADKPILGGISQHAQPKLAQQPTLYPNS